MDTGKHPAREQRVSCRDWSSHSWNCFGRAPAPSLCVSPRISKIQVSSSSGDFMVYIYIGKCLTTEILSFWVLIIPTARTAFFPVVFTVQNSRIIKLKLSSGDHVVNSLSSSNWANFKDQLRLFTALFLLSPEWRLHNIICSVFQRSATLWEWYQPVSLNQAQLFPQASRDAGYTVFHSDILGIAPQCSKHNQSWAQTSPVKTWSKGSHECTSITSLSSVTGLSPRVVGPTFYLLFHPC